MNLNDVVKLLGYITRANPGQTVEEGSAEVWHDLLADVDVQDALDSVRTILKRKPFVAVADIVAEADLIAIRRNRNAVVERDQEAHCGRAGCQCSHSAGCYRGWIDGDGPTKPCKQCRYELNKRLESVPPAGRRSEADMSRLRMVLSEPHA
jgi:hypothetical protein